MKLREFLHERYAILHNLKARSVELYTFSIDRFGDFLEREPELSDLEDLTVSKFLRWRAVTPHKGKVARPASVAKDKCQLLGLWNAAARKRLVEHFPDLARNIVRVPHRPPQAYTVEEISRMVRVAKTRQGMIGPVPAAWVWPTLLMSCYFTGERIGSHLEVRWQQIDSTRRTVTFLSEHRKGLGRTITRAITPQLVQMLDVARRGPDELVWPWLEYREIGSLWPRIRDICLAADVTPKGFHAIRKAAGSYVKAAGGDATEFLTHADGRTTKDHYLDPKIVGEASALDFLPPLDIN